MDSLVPIKSSSRNTIYVTGVSGGVHAGLNLVNEGFREVEEFQSESYSFPLNGIKGLPKIYLDEDNRIPSLRMVDTMSKFLDNPNNLVDTPIFDKSCLFQTYKVGQLFFQSVG